MFLRNLCSILPHYESKKTIISEETIGFIDTPNVRINTFTSHTNTGFQHKQIIINDNSIIIEISSYSNTNLYCSSERKTKQYHLGLCGNFLKFGEDMWLYAKKQIENVLILFGLKAKPTITNELVLIKIKTPAFNMIKYEEEYVKFDEINLESEIYFY